MNIDRLPPHFWDYLESLGIMIERIFKILDLKISDNFKNLKIIYETGDGIIGEEEKKLEGINNLSDIDKAGKIFRIRKLLSIRNYYQKEIEKINKELENEGIRSKS